jgi:anti-sigma factor RsiW
MTIDPETLMAYADGELDPIAAKRVERAMAADPALAEEVARHRALRARIAASFAPIAEAPVPDRLAALARSNLIAFPAPTPRPVSVRWRAPAALAACLMLGLVLGRTWPGGGSVTTHGGRLYASGPLAHALDTQLAAMDGAVKLPVSFHGRDGAYCRVFTSAASDGIACHDGLGWALRQTRSGSGAPSRDGGYAQAGSADAALMASAQEMMAGDPLDAAGEARARAAGWR